MATKVHVFLPEWQWFAGGDVHLQVHEIKSGDKFRNWMLDLQARVHLKEIEVAILVDDELDGASVGYPAALETRTAISPMRWRIASVTIGGR